MTTTPLTAEPPGTDIPSGASETDFAGAHETFLIVAGIAFVLMAASIFAYGFFGARITAGLDAACAEAAFDAALRLDAQGKTESALQKFRQAMEGQFWNPDRKYECGRALGNVLTREERFAEALEVYLGLPPEAFQDASDFSGFATALMRDGRLEEARRIGERWLEKAQDARNADPTTANILYVEWAHDLLLRVLEKQGRYQRALRHGLDAIDAHQAANPQGEVSGASLIVARLYIHQNKPDLARQHVDAFLKNTSDTQLYEEARMILDALDGKGPWPPGPDWDYIRNARPAPAAPEGD